MRRSTGRFDVDPGAADRAASARAPRRSMHESLEHGVVTLVSRLWRPVELVDSIRLEPIRGAWFVGPCRGRTCRALKMQNGGPVRGRRRSQAAVSRRVSSQATMSMSR